MTFILRGWPFPKGPGRTRLHYPSVHIPTRFRVQLLERYYEMPARLSTQRIISTVQTATWARFRP